jgi:hypothetical protein
MEEQASEVGLMNHGVLIFTCQTPIHIEQDSTLKTMVQTKHQVPHSQGLHSDLVQLS